MRRVLPPASADGGRWGLAQRTKGKFQGSLPSQLQSELFIGARERALSLFSSRCSPKTRAGLRVATFFAASTTV
jgi:hypothetical protein